MVGAVFAEQHGVKAARGTRCRSQLQSLEVYGDGITGTLPAEWSELASVTKVTKLAALAGHRLRRGRRRVWSVTERAALAWLAASVHQTMQQPNHLLGWR
jgi:hypothetical protein